MECPSQWRAVLLAGRGRPGACSLRFVNHLRKNEAILIATHFSFFLVLLTKEDSLGTDYMCFVGRGYFAAVYLADWLNMTVALLLGKGGLLLRKALRTRDCFYKTAPTVALRRSTILLVQICVRKACVNHFTF